MGNGLGGGIFLGFGIEVAEGQAELLLDVGEDVGGRHVANRLRVVR